MTSRVGRQTVGVLRKIRKYIEVILYGKIAKATYAKRLDLHDNDYSRVIKNIPINYFRAFSPEYDSNNDYYGIATVLKSYAGISNSYSIKGHIEHGIHFGTKPSEVEMVNAYNSLILMGPARLKYLKSLKRNKYVIGPYIYYAKTSQDLKEIDLQRGRNGKTLLVFPSHSVTGVNSRYDSTELCKEIDRIRKEHSFEKVLVCLYWKDFTPENTSRYEKNKFECVTAGHYLDPRFLNRLKTIIELSDVTMSNNIGTHIGYSFILNKPHYLFTQEIKMDGPDTLARREDVEVYGREEMIRELSTYSESINLKQKKIASYYFGTNLVLKKAELMKVLKEMA